MYELVILVWAGVSICVGHYIATNPRIFRELYNDIMERI
mgnify:FL=1